MAVEHITCHDSGGLIAVRTEADAGLRLIVEARQFLNRFDDEGLCRLLSRRWTRQVLAALLKDEREEVATTAAICLGLVGTFEDTAALGRCLHHDDYYVALMSERAMWSIWFRSSTKECREMLQSAVGCIHAEQFDAAEKLLDRILVKDPDFAESCNQRAVLHFLTSRFESAVMACYRTLALNPFHFGAAAGLGHCYLQLGQYGASVSAYRRALRIYPRMEGVRQQLRRARESAAAEGIEIRPPQVPHGGLSFRSIVENAGLLSH